MNIFIIIWKCNLILKYFELVFVNFVVFKDVFVMFDRDGEGFILIWELGFIMRFMGYVLIEVEFVDMINEVDFDGMCDVFFCEKCICIMRICIILKEDLLNS